MPVAPALFEAGPKPRDGLEFIHPLSDLLLRIVSQGKSNEPN